MAHKNFEHINEDELAAHIEHHQRAYYGGESEISDAEFDDLWDELRRRNPAHPLLNAVGADADDEHEKVTHILYMHSQQKAQSADDLLKWAQKHPDKYIAQYKLDGVSIELQYQDGAFAVAATRGDGVRGDNVTDNILRMAGVPLRIEGAFSGSIRGEIILPIAAHQAHYPQFANCRNTAAGIVKRKDGVGCEFLQIICYDALHAERPAYFEDNEALLRWLQREHFLVAQWRAEADIQKIVGWHAEVAEERARLPYEIDGLVVKTAAIMAEDRLLAKPKYQIAFKFTVEERTTHLQEVLWSQAGHLYTPIAVTEPVQLAGTTVQRANLVNMRLIREMGLHIGAQVSISKRGEIIPKIERLVAAAAQPVAISPPVHCVNCDAALIIEDTRVYCPNKACPQRVMHQLRRWIEVLDIKEFGEVLIRDLYHAGVLRRIADFYRLKVDDISVLERQGQRSAQNALRNLHRVQSMSLPRFVAALNIENVGEKTVQKLVDAGYDSVDALCTMQAEEIVKVEGVGEIMAAHICTSIAEHTDTMQDILSASGIQFMHSQQGHALSGKSFCFTGALQDMSRKEAEAAVCDKGGAVRKTVSTGLDFVVTNTPDASTAKLVRARAAGVSIINEEDFLALLDA